MTYNPEHLKDIAAFHLKWGRPHFVNVLYPNVIRKLHTVGGMQWRYAWTRGADLEYIEVVWRIGPNTPSGRGA